MMYKAIYTNKTTKEEVKRISIQADTLRQAQQTANNTDNMPKNTYCKVYVILDNAQAIQEASLQIVKRTTANMIQREGGDIQFRLYNGCRVPNIDDNDVLDCLQTVSLSLLESKADNIDIVTAYKTAYKALNDYLYSTRQIRLSVTAMRTVYIEDIDGDIINVNKGINTIVKSSDILPYIEDTDSDTDTLTGIILDILADLSPVQKRVIKLIANGNSYRQVAEKMNRKPATIQEQVNRIRKKVAVKYPNGIQDIKTLLKTL